MRTLNLGILAHVDAGEASLTERLLQAAGVIDETGSVDEGGAQTDSLAIGRQRSITIRSTVRSTVVPFLGAQPVSRDRLATVGLRPEPAPAGAGVKCRLEVELGSIRLAFHRAVEETVHETRCQGLYGWQVTGCTLTMTTPATGRGGAAPTAASTRGCRAPPGISGT